MKLYTEEEIKRLLGKQIIFDENDLDKLTTIELPSDEELEEQGNLITDLRMRSIYMLGAKWMRDLIQGGNK